MIAAVIGLSFLVARDVAADGWLLARALERSSSASRLPVTAMASAAEGLWLIVRDDVDPPARLVDRRRPNSGRRLELASRHYAIALRTTALETLPIDSSSWLYSTLIEAVVSDARGDSDVAWRRDAQLRAHATLGAVPEDQRSHVFEEAGVTFLGHALSVAHEIARHERRRRSRGATLCGRFDIRASLFGLWRRQVFGAGGRYTGYFRPASDADDEASTARPGWVESGQALSIDDRRWWAEAVLGVTWTGDPAVDFAWVCDAAGQSGL